MFGFLKDVGKAVVNVAKLPVSITLDVATMGGAIIDREESFTETNARQLKKNAEDAIEDLYEED
jgi:hypothetical protein